MDEEKIRKLREIIDSSNRIVFFGGAGVSTESGIPDFRSTDGLYSQQYDYPPEEILSHSFFMEKTDYFFDFYKKKMLFEGAKPNKAHYVLAKLEAEGKLISVITQNIDGLHQEAGSMTVRELHGSVKRNHCMRCGRFYTDAAVREAEGIPRCACGGIIKPDVVLYEEQLDDETVENAVSDIMRADTLIVAGTSLTVYPAAGLIDYFKGNTLVLINKSSTQADRFATLCINDKVGEVLSAAAFSKS